MLKVDRDGCSWLQPLSMRCAPAPASAPLDVEGPEADWSRCPSPAPASCGGWRAPTAELLGLIAASASASVHPHAPPPAPLADLLLAYLFSPVPTVAAAAGWTTTELVDVDVAEPPPPSFARPGAGPQRERTFSVSSSTSAAASPRRDVDSPAPLTVYGVPEGWTREAALRRFREKRARRCFAKRVRYEVRAASAAARTRVGGRFVKEAPTNPASGPSTPTLSPAPVAAACAPTSALD